MKTIIHLSDLHFGKINADTLKPLQDILASLKPHAVVISGDLTQRATIAEFGQAKQFLSTLPQPQIIVPGNHDIPLYNVFRRFFKPHQRFRMHIGEEIEPLYTDNEVMIIGVNTTRAFRIKEGRISNKQINRLSELFVNSADDKVKIIVTHHPFDIPPEHIAHPIVGRAQRTMKSIAQYQPDIFLSGHLHVSHTGSSATRYKIGNFNSLLVLAGTATSTRNRKQSNSFNALTVGTHNILIDRYVWQPEQKNFIIEKSDTFLKTDTGWQVA